MAMKVTSTDLENLRATIAEINTPERRLFYVLHEKGGSREVVTAKNINKRFRWDMYWIAVMNGFTFSNINELNDAHIDTALRNVVDDLKKL